MYYVQLDEENRVVAWVEADSLPDDAWRESPWGDEEPPEDFDDYRIRLNKLVHDPRDLPPAKLSETEAILEVLKAAPQILSAIPDETLLHMAPYVEGWATDTEYSVGDLRAYDDRVYRCLQAHTSQDSWNPADAPSLWAKVLNPDPGVIPVWEQPDSTNPYMKGDKVHYPDIDGPVYESLIDNNVYSPEAYPAGWRLVNEVVA